MSEKEKYTGKRCKTVDRVDNQYKLGTIVNEYHSFRGTMVDIAFDEDENRISTGHFLKYVIIKDTEEQ